MTAVGKIVAFPKLTTDDQKPIRFEGVRIKTEDDDQLWVFIRTVFKFLEKDDREAEEVVREMLYANDDMLEDMVGGWGETRERLGALIELIESAEARMQVVLDRINPID